jgi:hypothetical protein
MIPTESRTWRSAQNQEVYFRRAPCDDKSFEGQLPARARSELLEEFPSRRTYRLQESIPVPSPVFLRSPPLVSPLEPPPIRPGTGRELGEPAPRRGVGIWWLLAALLGFPVLIGLLPHAPSSQPVYGTQSISRWVEVRRALPVANPEVRRALPALARAFPVEEQTIPGSNGNWQAVQMPDGTIVEAAYQGTLPNAASLPAQGHFIGEEWRTGDTSWIWMTPAGANLRLLIWNVTPPASAPTQ